MSDTTRSRRLRLGAAATVPVVAATLALIHPGAHVTQVDLHDGSVWLTNAQEAKLGRYNPAVDELNGGLVAPGADVDVLQDAGDVLLLEPGRVSVVDPAQVVLAAQASVPARARVTMSRGVVAVVDPSSGDAWVTSTATLGGLAPEDPDLELGDGGHALVAHGGAVLTVTAGGDLGHLTLEADVLRDAGSAGRLPVPEGTEVVLDQVSAVGDALVAIAEGRLLTPSGSTDLTGHGELTLQQPGPRADHVLVATPTALLEVPLAGGTVREHVGGGSGRPAAPVRVGECAYAAWASAVGSYLQVCGTDVEGLDLEGMSSLDRLVFRVNRDVVVLNDTLRGRLWVPLEDPRLREPNWQDIEPEQETEEDEDDAESSQAIQNLQSECTATSGTPEANDDAYGVRPGRTTILSVIDNDTASDCGILTVSEHDVLDPDFGTVVPVQGGRALQLVTQSGATGTTQFTYTITDGRGTSAPSTATVTLTAYGADTDTPPEQLRVSTVLVEQGASVSHDVLADFRDPDGDPLVLVGASVDSGDVVRTRYDGHLTFTATGGSLGRQTVVVRVSDGDHEVAGALVVEVRPAGSLPPVVDPVHAETYVDQPVTVRPLTAVRNAAREAARLARVDEQPGVVVDADLERGRFDFTSARAGTYYVTFTVAAGAQHAEGLARIDVRERPEEDPPPVAVRDVALLPAGGEVTIDPLANDVDPAGRVLVLQSVVPPDGTGLQAAVLNHRLVRFSSTRALEEPVVVPYRISNGTADAVGEILVQPVPPGAGQQPPVVPDVTASVRTGGVVTIPVLDGAYDPDGDPLRLLPVLAEPPGAGLMFVSGETLRFQAPAEPGQVTAAFTVADPSGNQTTATVRITVHASDAAAKAPPRPRNLTARVLEGGTVRIPVPLVGIDPDGDGVLLLGFDRPPELGNITAQGADWIEYEALPGSVGTDTFTYAVEDWVGQRATATVRVGIAPRPTDATGGVVARDDAVTVRPGQRVEVRVLRNDVDLAGGELRLEELETPEGVEATIEGRRVVVTAPATPGVLDILYRVVSDRGGEAWASLELTVAEDAAFDPPVARDVVVPASETINRTSVEVDVLEVADNPSGSLADLAVSVPSSAADVATVTEQGRVLVQLGERARTLPYRLTNTHPLAEAVSSYAFITVPALGDFPPVRRPGAPALRVVAGETLEIPLAEQIQVAPGRTPQVNDTSRVSATRSDGSELVDRGRELLRYTPDRAYAGPASVAVEVWDGPVDDPSSRRSMIALPVTVLAAEASPPRFTPSVLDVGPGETVRVDLGVFTSAPVETATGTTAYGYRLTSTPDATFQVDLDGSRLGVTTSPDAARGTVGAVTLEIDYGGTTRLPVQVELRVVASSRPLARVHDHRIADGVEGRRSEVQVVGGATGGYNPFPAAPLTLVRAAVVSGQGQAGVSGQSVWVQPAVAAADPVVVRYWVRDVTGDPDREVNGTVTVIVRGRPETPRAPRVTEVRDRAVVLAWDAPSGRGEPVTGYRVTVQPGGSQRECTGTTCTIDGLTNDVEHTFTVQARNAVDWSDASPPSAPARPDAVPAAPASPDLEDGDQQLVVRWRAPESVGSPISGYTVEISPAPRTGPSSWTTTATSLTIGGLDNGTSYQVRVRAQNRAPDPGPWSPWSTEVPARAPDAPTVQAARVESTIGRQIRVTWTAGASGGDAIRGYELTITGDGRTRTVDNLTGGSFLLDDARNGVPYRFELRARNKRGLGAPGSATASTFGVPGTVGGLRLTVSSSGPAGQGTVEAQWAPADPNGSDVTHHRLRVDGTESVLERRSPGHVLTGLTGGTTVGVQVQACNAAGCGGWSERQTATPVTLASAVRELTLASPTVSGGWPSQVRASWSEPGQWGGASGRSYEYRFLRDGSAVHGWRTTSGPSDTVATLDLPRQWFYLGQQPRITVEVRTVTAVGTGPVADASRTVSAAAPGPVRDATLTLEPDGDAVRAQWRAPAASGGPDVESYEVRFRGPSGGWTGWTTVTETWAVHEISGYGTVRVEIRAVNGVGSGPTVEATVEVPPPPEPEPEPEPDPGEGDG